METETQPLWVTTREAMGKTWRVELWPDDAALGAEDGKSEALGRSWYTDQWIRIAAKRPLDGREETLLHEILHLAAKCGGISIKEAEVHCLANTIYAFLRGFGLWNEFPWPDREEKNGINEAR